MTICLPPSARLSCRDERERAQAPPALAHLRPAAAGMPEARRLAMPENAPERQPGSAAHHEQRRAGRAHRPAPAHQLAAALHPGAAGLPEAQRQVRQVPARLSHRLGHLPADGLDRPAPACPAADDALKPVQPVATGFPQGDIRQKGAANRI